MRRQHDGSPELTQRLFSLLALVLVAGICVGGAAGAAADVGVQGPSFSGTETPTGTKRAESVLWWNDGSWWANMWDTVTQDFHIFRLDTATQTWIDTKVTVDGRASTHADVLWDGTHLYVASHKFVPDGSSAVSGYPSYLYRFSYSTATKAYTLDAGFPATINNYRTETLVIDRDSTGQLWATWQQGNKIYVNRTLNGDDLTWGTPFELAVSGASVAVDDNSAVIAFGGDKMGVMWSNQTGSSTAMYFAVHNDADPDQTWQASRTAIQGPNQADDHINLKSLQSDGSGRVYAAVKTEHSTASAPQIMLLVRDRATGDWTSHTISRVSECPNRPVVVIDEENKVLHAYFTAPGPPGYSCNSSGGAIHEKTSPLEEVSFPDGTGTPVIEDADSPYVHNASSTKQNVTSATGILILAANSATKYYWHHYATIGPGTAPPPPGPPTAAFTGTPTSGTAPLTVSFTDSSTGTPTSWSWNFGDGGTSTAQNPSHRYSSAGTYTVTLTATNSAGTDTETKTDYVSVAAPPPATAAFTGTPTSGTAPLTVSFTDSSTGTPTSWSWDFGDGGRSTAQNPSHTYSSVGTYTVTLTVTNSSGTDTLTKLDYVDVTPPPPDFSLTASPTSQTIVRGESTTYTVTVVPTNGFTGVVELSVSGLPSGATATFGPNPVDFPTVTSSTLTVSTTGTAKIGSQTLTVTGVSGSLSRSTTVTLQIKRK